MISNTTFHYLVFTLSFVLLTTCSQRPEGVENILIKGSDTEVNLALSLAEFYMDQEPKVSIAVTGGGSGMGIAALINGKTDIANASRPMKAAEISLAQDRGIQPEAIVFAMDALAIIVHPGLNINQFTLDQLGAIFKGDLTNWSELGGPNLAISLYGRQSNSGTFVYFRDAIVKGEYSAQLKQMNGTAQIVEAIKTDPAGIGYVGVGYVLDKEREAIVGVKVLDVLNKENNIAFSPLEVEAIQREDYPIVRPLFQYTNGKPKGQLKTFMRFCISEKGQQIVGANGYYPISEVYRLQNKQILE